MADTPFEAWRRLLGPGRVFGAAQGAERYGACTTAASRRIAGGLCPERAAQIPEIVNIARAHGTALYPISTGRNWGYSSALPVTDDCVVLDLSDLRGILGFDPELGLVTLEPGVTQADLADYLDREGLPFMVPVTGAGPDCSLVGNALERGYGITPHADHFAAVMHLEAVLADGRTYRTPLTELGGAEVDRAFKWGLGPYLDGLFTQGGFGIVTRMTIALARIPERTEAFFFAVQDDAALEEAVTRVRTTLSTFPGVTGSVNLMNSHRMLAMTVPYPHDRTDSQGVLPSTVVAELADRHRIPAWTGFGALYGTRGVVKAARRTIQSVLRPVVRRSIFISPERARRVLRVLEWLPGTQDSRLLDMARRLNDSVEIVMGRPNRVALNLVYWRSRAKKPPEHTLDPARDGPGLIWYSPLVPMRPDAVRRYVDMVHDTCRRHGIEPLITLTGLSERCFDSTVPLLFDRDSSAETAAAQACYEELFAAGCREGFVPYRLNVDSIGMGCSPDSPYWEMAIKIKQALDPDQILSPGRYVPPPGA